MQDAVEFVRAEQRRDRAAVGEIADHKLGFLRHGLPMALRQVVEHDDLVAAAEQVDHDMAADIAGAAGDEKRAHGVPRRCD